MTIAYSEKYQTWVSRYSFEPTCYSTIGNTMVSFKDGATVWSHDTNESRCVFYGDPAGASIEVVSNQDPSAIKMFKSLSVETNASGWSGQVFTNDEYSGNEKQEGDILASFFKNKEGFKYADMPRSKINSSTIQPLGRLNPISYIDSDEPDYSGKFVDYIVPIISSQAIIANPDYIENSDTPFWVQAVIIDGSSQFTADTTFLFELPVNLINNLVVGSTPVVQNEDGSFSVLDKLKIVSSGQNSPLSPGLETLVFSCNLNDFAFANILGIPIPTGLVQYVMGNLYNPPVINSDGAVIPPSIFKGKNVFGQSDSQIEGDQMRGPYVRIKLENQTTDPFELHAINVDYEFSKLDKRLTQNS